MSKHNDPTAIDRPTNEPSTETGPVLRLLYVSHGGGIKWELLEAKAREIDAEITTLTDALTEAQSALGAAEAREEAWSGFAGRWAAHRWDCPRECVCGYSDALAELGAILKANESTSDALTEARAEIKRLRERGDKLATTAEVFADFVHERAPSHFSSLARTPQGGDLAEAIYHYRQIAQSILKDAPKAP